MPPVLLRPPVAHWQDAILVAASGDARGAGSRKQARRGRSGPASYLDGWHSDITNPVDAW